MQYAIATRTCSRVSTGHDFESFVGGVQGYYVLRCVGRDARWSESSRTRIGNTREDRRHWRITIPLLQIYSKKKLCVSRGETKS